MALNCRLGWLKLQIERESRITCTQLPGMIPGIKPGAFHTKLRPHNSKEVGYYYSQLVNEKKEIQRTSHATALFPFCFHHRIYHYLTYIHMYIHLFPYVQIIRRQKKKLRITFMQQSCIFNTTWLGIWTFYNL